jgi:hypothetical protein
MIFGGWTWLSWWDLSWLSTTYFGAIQLNKSTVIAWAEPLADAYAAGAWIIYWTDDTLYWIAKPILLKTNERRLHCQDGPALISDLEDLYFWQGTLIPRDWIEDKLSLSAKDALTWPNLEQRRIACSDIVGWSQILSDLDASVIDTNDDPQIGTLLQVQLPDLPTPSRFCRVKCGTGREFAVGVPPEIATALEAQAWMQGVPLSKFKKPEIRT